MHFFFLVIHNRPLHNFFSFYTIIQLSDSLLKLHGFTLSHKSLLDLFVSFYKVRLSCNTAMEENNKIRIPRCFKKQASTVVETGGCFLFFLFYCLSPPSSLLIQNGTYQCGPSVWEGRATESKGRLLSSGGDVMDFFLASLQHPYLKVSPHFLSCPCPGLARPHLS